MSYSPYDLVKRQAKALAREFGIPRMQALEQLARRAGFADLHEMSTVARRAPLERRLLLAAFGIERWKALEDHVLVHEIDELNRFVEEDMSGAVAETNAVGFYIDDYAVGGGRYDIDTGLLQLRVDVHYAGDPDPDRTYLGSSFDCTYGVRLHWSGADWERDDEPFEPWETRYEGERDRRGDARVLVDGEPLDPRTDLVDHGGNFEYGFIGSGSAQLALALLADHFGGRGSRADGDEQALDLYMDFRDHFIATLDRDRPWWLDRDTINETLGGMVSPLPTRGSIA